MNKKLFLLCEKPFCHINHHQLLNEYILHNFFCFLSKIINCQEQTEKRKNALPCWELALCHYLFYVTPFLNKTSLSKSFCSLRSGFQRAIYDASKFFLVLAFFGAFEMTAHVKQWLMLLQRSFDGSELLVGLLCSFHLTSALRLVSPM